MESNEAGNIAQNSMSAAYNTAAEPVTIKSLLDAGAHFGHQTERWNPKMLPFIYGARNGVHIINLDLTQKRWEQARKYIVDRVALGGNVLFVGTKLQAKDIIHEEAKRAGAYYITSRWLGGTLTNFQTIKNSIDRMRRIEGLLADAAIEGSKVRLLKKEKLEMTRELEKLEASLGGIRNMRKLPDLLFVVDVVKEEIAVKEARRLHIPVIGLVDTNADPEPISFPIPSNDDSSRTIRLFVHAVADAIIEGRRVYESRFPQNGDKNAKNGHAVAEATQAPTAAEASTSSAA